MKLISNPDVNGNKFINGELTLQLPAQTGSQTIATLADLEQFGGAFQFKGAAKSINEEMTIITLNDDTTVTASEHEGNVYQISDKEYASNGSVWVELGFNIDLTPYLTKSEAASTYETIANVSALAGRVTTAEGNITSLDGRLDTAEENITSLQNDLEEAEEVTSAALNDLNSRVSGLDSDIVTINTAVEGLDDRLTAAEGDIDSLEAAIEGLSGDAVKSVAFGSNTAIEPGADGKVTLTAATDSADGYMTATDHAKLTGIAAGAEVNVQADWAESDSSSDAYIANKPTNLAATYVYEPTEAQYMAKTVTIAATAHKCGLWPLVQVYYGMDVVSANVSVVVNNQNHDVTVSWEVAADSTHPIHIRIVG